MTGGTGTYCPHNHATGCNCTTTTIGRDPYTDNTTLIYRYTVSSPVLVDGPKGDENIWRRFIPQGKRVRRFHVNNRVPVRRPRPVARNQLD